MSFDKVPLSFHRLLVSFLLLVVATIPRIASAQDEGIEDYKVRITALWFHSSPTVTMEAASHGGLVDFNRDFQFNDYSTFVGKFDWKFTHKNHLYFVAVPYNQSKSAVLNRTITFRGQTFDVGLLTSAELHAVMYAPGYQYDIIRRKRGHLGIAVQFNLFDTTGTFNAAAQVTASGTQHAAVFSQASLLAPVPVAGPEYRLYLKEQRLFIDGNINGMYLFGYGNYMSVFNTLGFAFNKHFVVKAGYAYASRLRVNDTSKRLGLNLDQRGPTVGIETSF